MSGQMDLQGHIPDPEGQPAQSLLWLLTSFATCVLVAQTVLGTSISAWPQEEVSIIFPLYQ